MQRRVPVLIAWCLVVASALTQEVRALAQETQAQEAQPQETQASESHADAAKGRPLYAAYCARCHGMTGGGGEGPSLARHELPRAPDDEALIAIVIGGIPGTAMGSTWWLSAADCAALAAYVRSLAPTVAAADDLRGDSARGREIFEGTGGCGSCHTVGGFGTNRGPDLSTVGARRGVPYIRQAILDPAATSPRGLTEIGADFVDYLVVRVVDLDGREVVGMRLNEDSYSIQVRDAGGRLHSFYKPDLQTLEKHFDASLMQSYRDQLSEAEIDDLVAYLSTLRG